MRSVTPGRSEAGRAEGRASGQRKAILSRVDGTAAVEFAILLPVFLTFLYGIVEFGRLMWTQTALQFAVEGAARCYAIDTTCTSASTTQNYASQQVFGLTVPSSAFLASNGAGTSCGGYEVQVSDYPFSFVVPNLFPWTITVNAQSCHP
jgi:Flp pilus assembly protein TadG